MNQMKKRSMLAVAVLFAAQLFVITPAKAEIMLSAGAGSAVLTPVLLTENTQESSLSEIKTDEEYVSQLLNTEIVTDQSEDAPAAEMQSLTAEAPETPEQTMGAPATVSGDSSETTVDASAVLDTDEEEPVVLTVGAGSAVDDSLQLTQEEIEDEFAEEDASGIDFGYTHLGIVQVDNHLNVRASEAEDSKIVGKMENEAGCEILEIKGNMAHITSGSVEGYVSLDYLITGPEAVEYASTVLKEVATVKADGLKLRQDKSTESPVYTMVPYGEQLEVVEEDGDWIAVKYDGNVLYVAAEYVSIGVQLKTALNMTEFLYGAGVSDVRMELCEYAKQFVGNPYVWGGESLTKGCDCSGFVLAIYKKYGVTLPHSSRAQVNCGTRVSLSEAKPGDLVFYAKGKRINHVGIYIGGGQIVNASSPKTGIRIANVYYRKPVAVTRILN